MLSSEASARKPADPPEAGESPLLRRFAPGLKPRPPKEIGFLQLVIPERNIRTSIQFVFNIRL